MIKNSVFQFKDEQANGLYDYYLFKDFSHEKNDVFFDILDDIRKKIHAPQKVFVISETTPTPEIKQTWDDRFQDRRITVEHIQYNDVSPEVFQTGINQIVKKNKVVQYAPSNTNFKKTSGKESAFFIKASLALSDYPQICFLSLALYQKLEDKISSFEKIYIDTSTIMPLAQALDLLS